MEEGEREREKERETETEREREKEKERKGSRIGGEKDGDGQRGECRREEGSEGGGGL